MDLFFSPFDYRLILAIAKTLVAERLHNEHLVAHVKLQKFTAPIYVNVGRLEKPETGIRNRNGNGNRNRNRNRKQQRNRNSNVKGNQYKNRDIIYFKLF